MLLFTGIALATSAASFDVVIRDNEGDNRYWMRNNSEWIFGVKELERWEIWNGYVKNVVDGEFWVVTKA